MRYGDKLLNIKSNPNLKSKEVKFKVSMENETQFCERLTKLKTIPLISSFIMTERWMVKGTEVLQLTNRAQKRKQ